MDLCAFVLVFGSTLSVSVSSLESKSGCCSSKVAGKSILTLDAMSIIFADEIMLMAEIMKQLVGSLSYDLPNVYTWQVVSSISNLGLLTC